MIKTRLKAYIILIKSVALALTLIITNSCSTYITYLEKEEASHIHEIPQKEGPLYCPVNSRPKYNLIHESEFGIEEFGKIMANVEKQSQDLSMTEYALLYTLYNSFVRPDATNWNSRLQFYIHQNGKDYYYDFHEEQHNFEQAIKTFKDLKISSLSTNALLKLAKHYFPKKFTVQKRLSDYLDKYRQKLNAYHTKKYFRLGKPLQKGETFRANFQAPQLSKKKIHSSKQAPLFSANPSPFSQCNFDSKLYDSGIFIIHDDSFNENIFGIVKNNGNFAMIASTAGEIVKAKKNLSQSLIRVPKFNIPLCRYKDPNKTIINIAYASRDSGQLLHHLNQYQYFNSTSREELIQYTNYARHLFLTNPPRMLYESKRGTPQELNHFLTLNFPVYHAKSIGIIQSIAKFDDQPFTFIEDERGNTFQSCLKSN